jgi:hypothetical protein
VYENQFNRLPRVSQLGIPKSPVSQLRVCSSLLWLEFAGREQKKELTW